MTSILRREDASGVATLTLTAAGARNPLGLLAIDSLIIALADTEKDESVGAIVIAAEGPAVCAGHDLMQGIAEHPKPVIAAVEGIATAAGCQLVAACDLAVAGEAARFALPGVDIGLFCSTPLVAVGRAVSRKAAMEMALTGAPIAARRAEALGLVNRVVPSGEALKEAQALAVGIAARSRAVVALGKRAFQRQIETTLADAYRLAGNAMVENLELPDATEGIDAFLAKRSPVWSGR
jgi:enoyl-CoA hydratase/carnithine racemase